MQAAAITITTNNRSGSTTTPPATISKEEEFRYASNFFARLCFAARQDYAALDGQSLFPKHSEATQPVLTKSDQLDRKLHRIFRTKFPKLDVQQISEDSFLNDNEQLWNALLQQIITGDGDKNTELIPKEEAEIPTQLRKDFLDMYWLPSEGEDPSGFVLLVPRYQFFFIELCRIREGLYCNRYFRRILEVFDLKTQADRFRKSFMEFDKSQDALDALQLLKTQWPNPSQSALSTTQIIPLLKKGRTNGSTETIQTSCQQLLEHWKSLKNLEELFEILHSAGEEAQKAEETLIQQDEQNSVATAELRTPNRTNIRKIKATMDILTFPARNKDDRDTSKTFREFGAVFLSEMVPSLEDCALQATESLEAFIEEHLEPRGLTLEGADRFELPMVQQLQGNRVDYQYKLLDNAESPIARLGRQLQKQVPNLLSLKGENNFRLDQAGVIHCLATKRRRRQDNLLSDTEPWHCDGFTLFADTHHDAHAFNVFIPLTEMVDANGAMEFVPGSHVNEVYHQAAPGVADLAEKDSSAQHDLAVRANVAAGTMLVVDSRLYVRGLANKSEKDRRILYFKYSQSWFHKGEEGRQTSFLRGTEIHSKLLIANRLYQLVSGMPSSQLASIEETVGHTFFTSRFDLLLLEDLLSGDHYVQATAMANIAGIIHFCKLSEGDKEVVARQFVYCFSDNAHLRRAKVLRRIRAKRQKSKESAETDFALVTIIPGTVEAVALADLTAAIVMEESTLLSKLGFTSDPRGLAILLAMLKAHAARDSLGCIGITGSTLEECFTLWWHARNGGRFTWFRGEDGSKSNRSLLVIFTGLDSSHKVQPWSTALQAADNIGNMDVLHVLDPSFSCFCQDPSGNWDGCNYYFSEIFDRVSQYHSVVFLGDSIGAGAALRFSRLASRVLVFSPVVDVVACKTLRRTDFPDTVKDEFRDKLLEEVKYSKAQIFVHYAKYCQEHGKHVQQLPKRIGLELFGHQHNDDDLFSQLLQTKVIDAILQGEVFPKATSLG